MLAWPAAGQPSSPARSTIVPVVDHHVHLLSPVLVRDWKSLGVPFSRPDAVYVSAEALMEGEHALRQALLVPMAHLYGRQGFREALKLSLDDERARVRAENDHVAREAARWPGRAVALCSVGWNRPYAWEELRRCRSELKTPGVKLHLASAGTDLRDAAQRAGIARVLAWAEREGLAVLLHFDPQRRGLEAADVERFADQVLGPHPRLEVQIAHLGGSGGYGRWTRAVLGAFSGWLERERAAGRAREGVFFDVSAAILERESEGVPATTDEEAAAFRADLLSLGPARLLFASDYPVFDPRAYAELLAARAGLDEATLRAMLSNRAPILRRANPD